MGLTYSKIVKNTLALIVAIPVCCIASFSLAQEQQEKAREYYNKAQDAYSNEDFTLAEEYFQKAYDIKPHPAVLKSIAECKLQLGQVPDAIALLEELIADPNYKKKKKIKKRLKDAKKQVAFLTIESNPTGATVILNGRTLDDQTPLSLYVVPGKQTIELTMESYPDQLRAVKLKKGTKTTVKIDFTEFAPEDKQPALIEPFDEDSKETENDDETGPALDTSEFDENGDESLIQAETSGPPKAFWAAAAVAGVGVISGTVFGTMAIRDENDYAKSGDSATKDSGERSAIIADISFGVALAAAVTGVIILVVNKNKKESTAKGSPSFQLAPVVGKQTMGVASGFSF